MAITLSGLVGIIFLSSAAMAKETDDRTAREEAEGGR